MGIVRGIRDFVAAYQKPVVVYLKFENWLPTEAVKALFDEGAISWIKYAVVREDPLHTRALTLLGNAQLAAGFQARAVQTLEQAAQSDPGDEAALRAFAAALTETGQAGRARAILDLLREG